MLLASCTLTKKPTFKKVDKIEIIKADLSEISLKADAVFENPNHLKGTLSIEDLQVFIDEANVGTINATEFKVPAKSDFTIPLEGTFSLSKIYKENKNNLLSSVLKAAFTDSLSVRYKGKIKYHLGDFSYPYKIDEEQTIILK